MGFKNVFLNNLCEIYEKIQQEILLHKNIINCRNYFYRHKHKIINSFVAIEVRNNVKRKKIT